MGSISIPPLSNTHWELLVRSQFLVKPRPPPKGTSLCGQTAIITGGNSGIGLETAHEFLELGVKHLILGVRSVKKGEEVAIPMREAHPEAKVEVWPLDMLSYQSIQEFAERCTQLSRLDIAILNAAFTQKEFKINPSTKHEEVFQVNYLSTALLAILLLPTLKAKSPTGTPGRLTLVCSGTALASKFPNRDAVPLIPSFDDGTGWDLFAANDRYGTSKTLVQMLTHKLGELVPREDVLINTVDPGLTGGSGLFRDAKGPLLWAIKLWLLVAARTLRQAAWTYVDAAVVKGEATHGSYLMNLEIYP